MSSITVEALICAQNWLKIGNKNVNDLLVELDETKNIESGIKTPTFSFSHLFKIFCSNDIFYLFLELYGLTLNNTNVGTDTRITIGTSSIGS